MFYPQMVDRMKSVETISDVFSRYGWVLRRKELTLEGVSACTLRRMERDGWIVRPRAGYYEWVFQPGNSELTLVRRLFPEAILCMHSALYIYGYTDRVPTLWHLSAPLRATRSKYRRAYPRVKGYFLIPETLALGKTETEWDGQIVPVYDRDRTICDCIARRKRMDREIFNKALRAYCEDPQRDISRLMEYARKLNIERPATEIISLWQ